MKYMYMLIIISKQYNSVLTQNYAIRCVTFVFIIFFYSLLSASPLVKFTVYIQYGKKYCTIAVSATIVNLKATLTL